MKIKTYLRIMSITAGISFILTGISFYLNWRLPTAQGSFVSEETLSQLGASIPFWIIFGMVFVISSALLISTYINRRK